MRCNGETYKAGRLWREAKIAEPYLPCNGEIHVTRTSTTKRQAFMNALSGNHWHKCQSKVGSQNWSNRTESNQRQTAMVLAYHHVIHPLKPKNVRRVFKATAKNKGVAVKDIFFSKTRPAADSGRNYISLPRTPNSLISRIRSNFSSNCSPSNDSLFTFFLARRHRK